GGIMIHRRPRLHRGATSSRRRGAAERLCWARCRTARGGKANGPEERAAGSGGGRAGGAGAPAPRRTARGRTRDPHEPRPPGARRPASSVMRVPLGAALAIFLLAFLWPAWPWLSGEVTIPWDAKSQFFPQVQFLASSFARGEWPWWSPNVFAGWPQISDPQSL